MSSVSQTIIIISRSAGFTMTSRQQSSLLLTQLSTFIIKMTAT